MNHLLAKLKGKSKTIYKVISNADFFALPNELGNSIPFQASYKPDEDEWFSITSFAEKDYCIDFLKKEFISTEYSQIDIDDYDNVKYLIAVQGENYFFQNLSASQVIQKKYFTVGAAPRLINNARIIVIDPIPDAIYNASTDTLYFKNIIAVNMIFKGMDTLFKEATDEETIAFLNNDFISLNAFSADSVKKPNRKRIALAMQTLNNLDEVQRPTILSYIRDYYPSLPFNETNQSFEISNEEDLKNLIYGIEQRYYTTIVGNERRRANSIQSIS